MSPPSDSSSDEAEALGPALVSGLVARFAPFGVAGVAALEAVIPKASPTTAKILADVLAACARNEVDVGVE